MIRATIYEDENKYIYKYTVKGHSNYDKYGRDIVCAAISVLTQNTLISLNQVVGIDESKLDYHIEEETGFMSVTIDQSIDIERMETAQILLRSLVIGLDSIAKGYPKHVIVKKQGV